MYTVFIYLTHLYLLAMEEGNTSTKSKMVIFRSDLISLTTSVQDFQYFSPQLHVHTHTKTRKENVYS